MIYNYNGNRTFNRTFNCLVGCVDDIEGKVVYAFAYQEDERALNYFCEPVKGMIKNRVFYEFTKDGSRLKRNGVSIWARYFADTYEEAVEGFNHLLQRRINSLLKEVKKLEKKKIK